MSMQLSLHVLLGTGDRTYFLGDPCTTHVWSELAFLVLKSDKGQSADVIICLVYQGGQSKNGAETKKIRLAHRHCPWWLAVVVMVACHWLRVSPT